MDATMSAGRRPLANGQPIRRSEHPDGLGTTHHETGTLWMGTDPTRASPTRRAASITPRTCTPRARRLFPTHRLAEPDAHRHRAGAPHRRSHHDAASVRAGPGLRGALRRHVDRRLEDVDHPQSAGPRQSGHVPRAPRRVRGDARHRSRPAVAHAADAAPLRAAAAVDDDGADDNSGVFVGFPHPEQQGYDNTAYVGVNFGFEIQIDELARPDNAPIHRTGAIYSFKGPTDGPRRRPSGRRVEPDTRSPSTEPTSRWR